MQNAVLKDIHLQQAAGITEMILGVKQGLKDMQTLKNRDGQTDAGLEIFNKIGGGGFGEVFKGKYKGVRIPSMFRCLIRQIAYGFHHAWTTRRALPLVASARF